MKLLSAARDNRIGSSNLYVKMSFGEYLELAPKIISNNKFQRKRVKTSKSVYSLLKKDLQQGCIMPPLVLAFTGQFPFNIETDDAFSDEKTNQVWEYMNAHTEDILILDGLQRTYTLIDADAELRQLSVFDSPDDLKKYDEFCRYTIRIEIYFNINKFGVLYRMLTLNTGQTPMSARHQIEMLYSDMLDTDIEGIRLVSDLDGTARPSENEFLFKNAVEGFHSYMNRNELPIDRQELLENIKMLEKMSEEAIDADLFKEYLECYINVFKTLRSITEDKNVTEDDLSDYAIQGVPFGYNISKAFSTSQALTGFGAAIGRMKDRDIITGFSDINNMMDKLKKNNNGMGWFLYMLSRFDLIREKSKKIGNAQRMYFQYFFRELFNDGSDSYLDLSGAVENGYQKYLSQV